MIRSGLFFVTPLPQLWDPENSLALVFAEDTFQAKEK